MERTEIRVLDTYTVHIGYGILEQVGKQASQTVTPSKALIVTDDNIPSEYIAKVETSLKNEGFEVFVFVIPAGETSKSAAKYIELLNFAAKCRLCRSDIMIALGGGVVGDLTGFAAATYMRGVKYIQIPTTLLAAVDSSVGGKTAIDLTYGKNLAGAFYQPSAVICDISTLTTLNDTVLRDGMAEVIKYAHLGEPKLLKILTETQDLLYSIKNATDRDVVTEVISRCIALKAKIVESDPFDKNQRQLLNFGHTAGHAIELLSDFTISHGHAVATGMCLMTRGAEKLGLCPENFSQNIIELNKKYNLPTHTDFNPQDIFEKALSDKKTAQDKITVVLPKESAVCDLYKMTHSQLRQLIIAGTEQL